MVYDNVMKKYLILAAAALMCLSACAQNNKKMNENKTLIAWFSWSGNTEAVVNHIAEVTGAGDGWTWAGEIAATAVDR